MTRSVGNWLQAYAEYSAESESPDSFHFWCALWALSSSVRRNVWIDQGIYILFPNIYVFLVGPTGRVSKTTAIRMAQRLMRPVDDIVFGPDSITVEDLIRFMARAGRNKIQSAVTIASGELASILKPSGIHMITFLTDIYDGDYSGQTWKYSTKQKGRDTISNPCLNMVAGTTAEWLADEFPVKVTGHGFTSRVIFTYEDTPKEPIPFPRGPDPQLRDALVEDLQHVSRLEGGFELTKEARELYEIRYREVFDGTPTDFRIAGFFYRKAKVHLLKVAMLLSLAERDELVIHPQDLEAAWTLLQAVEESMPKAFSAVGKYEYASDLERIISQIAARGEMSAKDVYSANRAVGDAETLGRILQMAMKIGAVESFTKGKDLWFRPAGDTRS